MNVNAVIEEAIDSEMRIPENDSVNEVAPINNGDIVRPKNDIVVRNDNDKENSVIKKKMLNVISYHSYTYQPLFDLKIHAREILNWA